MAQETHQEIANAAAKELNEKATKSLGLATALVVATVAAATVGVMLWRKAVREAHKTADDAAQVGIESLEKMQVEYYNLRQSAEKVDSLADSFDTLSRKINKSTEDLQELQSIAQQINDEAGKQIVDTTASIEAQRK